MASPRCTPGGVKASSSETLKQRSGCLQVHRGGIGSAPPLAILVPQRRLNGVWVGCRLKKKKIIIILSPNMSAPPRRCWVGNAASSVCAVGQRTHPAEVQSEPHLPSDVVLGQLVTERIGLENGIVLSFSS